MRLVQWTRGASLRIIPRMDELYDASSRRWQDTFDTRRLADRIEERLVTDELDEGDRAFIERLDMLFLATADAEGRPQCSYKGGDPGFVRVLDPRTIAFPTYDGNGMFLSLGNVEQNAHVAILFVDFERPSRLRLNGRASVRVDDPLLGEWPGAQAVVRVAVDRVFPNCPRYVHRMVRDERSPFVPVEGCEPPVPDWKRRAWSHDVLPSGDPARGVPPLEG
jgi:uncharacterized protein